MIKIEMNKGNGTIEIKGCHKDVLAEVVMVILKLLEPLNDDDVELIKKALTEVADE